MECLVVALGTVKKLFSPQKVDDVTTLLLQHIKCVIAIYLEVQIMDSFSKLKWGGFLKSKFMAKMH